MNRDEAWALAEQGVEELIVALEQGRSERLLEYLAFQARFHCYSFNNCLLIAIQKPDATYVAGFQRWKELGRFVRKGEKGVMILAPLVKRASTQKNSASEVGEETTSRVIGFRATYVFDVSQTDGEELPQFCLITGDPSALTPAIRRLVSEHGIDLRYEEQLGGADGMSEGGRIAIRRGLPAAEEFAVMVHELAHELLHRSERRKETTRTIRELEAEAVAFVVCRAAGLDGLARSSDYIQLYQGDKQMLVHSLSHIQRVAAQIIDGLSSSTDEQSLRDAGTETLEASVAG